MAMTLTHPSLANIPESELITKLLSNIQWRHRIIGIEGIPSNVLALPNISLNGLPNTPSGDIDILLVPPGLASQSIAVQVKRIKVQDDTFRTESPNKLQEIPKGIRQANLLAQIGFAQVYYFVFVVVDSRLRNGGHITYEGLTSTLRSKLDEVISVNGLEPRVGLMHFDFIQPIDDEPLGAGSYRARLKRLATSAIQPQHITDWITEVASRQI